MRTGQVGEAAVRAAYDIGEPTKILINGRNRIPDGLIEGQVLSEVKNVESLSLTAQLRDYAEYAGQQGIRFDLYLRANTRVSGPLQQLIDRGVINRLDIPQ